MKKQEKIDMVGWIKDELETAPSAVVADYRGLTVAKMTDLRGRCRQAGVRIKVLKNTLVKLAVKDTDKDELAGFLEGPSIIAWHTEDPGAPAKIFADFAKEKGNEALEIKGAVASGQLMDANQVKSVLATMPSRPELLAQMAMLINAGPQKLHGVLSAGPNMLGRVLGALKDKKAA